MPKKNRYSDNGPRLRYPVNVAIVCVVALLSALASHFVPYVRYSDIRLSILRSELMNPGAVEYGDVVVLSIGEPSLAPSYGDARTDHAFLADLIEQLGAQGARAIGLDLILDGPGEPNEDYRLMQAMRTTQAPVTVAWVGERIERATMSARQRRFFHSLRRATGVQIGLVPMLIDEPFASAGWHRVSGDNPRWRSFPVAVAESADLHDIPDGAFMIDFYLSHPRYELPRYQLHGASNQAPIPREWVKGKFVLIGATAPTYLPAEMGGFGKTAEPLSRVEMHAYALSDLLAFGGVWSMTLPMQLLTALGLSALGLTIATRAADLHWQLILLLVCAVTYVLGTLAAAGGWGTPLPLIGPLFALLASYLASVTWGQRPLRLQRRMVTEGLRGLAAPPVIQAVRRDPQQIATAAQRRQVSLVSTDLCSFNALAESLTPQQLAGMMETYIGEMAHIVFEHGGMLEKLHGAAVDALFGAPLEQPDHVQRAVACALELNEFAQVFAEQHASQVPDFGLTCIGVSTGEAMVGNFGSPARFNFSAHGKPIDVARGLRAATSHLGIRICVAQATAILCPAQEFRPVGELCLGYAEQPITAFEPLYAGQGSRPRVQGYRHAYNLTVGGRLEEARLAFEALHKRFPDDALVRFHTERLLAGDTSMRIHIGSLGGG